MGERMSHVPDGSTNETPRKTTAKAPTETLFSRHGWPQSNCRESARRAPHSVKAAATSTSSSAV